MATFELSEQEIEWIAQRVATKLSQGANGQIVQSQQPEQVQDPWASSPPQGVPPVQPQIQPQYAPQGGFNEFAPQGQVQTQVPVQSPPQVQPAPQAGTFVVNTPYGQQTWVMNPQGGPDCNCRGPNGEPVRSALVTAPKKGGGTYTAYKCAKRSGQFGDWRNGCDFVKYTGR